MITKKLRTRLSKQSFTINIFETTIFLIDDKEIFQSVYDDIKHEATTEEETAGTAAGNPSSD